MKRNNMISIMVLMLLCCYVMTVCGQEKITGVVYDRESGIGLPDVNVMDEENKFLTTTDSLGRFEVVATSGRIMLQFTKMGYEPLRQTSVSGTKELRVLLKPLSINIEEIEINTGYQWIPRERATGSFVHLDRTQLEAIPARSIIDKLDGIMPGLQFDKRNVALGSGSPIITVRGMNSFHPLGAGPLIVVDNFPYEGDLGSIDPNDVESVTMLRDAAATSIWGARAGNGVLVINLKKPDQSGRTVVSWSSNVSVTAKPDLYYQPTMSSSDFVDVELFLYEQGHYRSALTGSNAHLNVFSPVVQAIYDLERGKIDSDDLAQIIQDARDHDYRDDMLTHVYRNSVSQNHHFSISKRTNQHSFRFSAGVNHLDGLGNIQGARSNTRYTFNLVNSYRFSTAFDAELSIYYTLSSTQSDGGNQYPLNPGGGKLRMYPYLRLTDENGLPQTAPFNLNPGYVDTVGSGMLLDWTSNPLRDQQYTYIDNRQSKLTPTFTLRYRPVHDLQLEAIYSGDFQYGINGTRYAAQSYYTRDFINRYSQINGDRVVRPIPLGEIYDRGHSELSGHKFRFHGKMDRQLSDDSHFSWILGSEIGSVQNSRHSYRVYGYDPYLMVSVPVDHTVRHPLFLGGTSTIANGQSTSQSVRRVVSFYGNASFAFKKKYVLTASARRDASNVFGAKSNDRWNPLWSIGLAWRIDQETFMDQFDWLSNLRFRITHGHSGNLGGGTTSDRVVIMYGLGSAGATYTNLPFAMISSPPNPSLKWENVQMNNFAIDFGFLNGRINGSVEYFLKDVTDLISYDPLESTTGYFEIQRNVAGLRGRGWDVNVDFDLLSGPVSWRSGVSLSSIKDKVTAFNGFPQAGSNYTVMAGNNVLPVVGKSLLSVYSFHFGGLDPLTGDPFGYQNGELSKDYSALMRDSLGHLVYHGTAKPVFFGFVNNNLRYRNFNLFTNISFRGGHYFRRSTIDYSGVFNSWDTHADYSSRWQKPGDEKVTTIPSMVYPAVPMRETFYAYSEATVERGDIIRLQQIRFSYLWNQPFWKINHVELGIHIDNAGIIWKASKGNRDPDYEMIPPARMISTNVRLQF